MWNKLVYKFDKGVYTLFYWRWNKRFAHSPELRQQFLDTFKVWEGLEQKEPSKLAMKYAIQWSRTSKNKTNENLAKLFEQAIWDTRNTDPRCKNEDTKRS